MGAPVRRSRQRLQVRRLFPRSFTGVDRTEMPQCEVPQLVGSRTPGSPLRASEYEERERNGLETSGARERQSVGVRAVY